MLGAQALRTKQKAEQKEKEKKHRERLKSLEIQREKLHKQACEDAARNYMENLDINAHPPIKSNSDNGIAVSKQHRHSVHTTTMHNVQPHVHKHNTPSMNGVPQRSPSSDYCNKEKKDSGNRLMRWLGLSSAADEDKKQERKLLKQRRMSTFT